MCKKVVYVVFNLNHDIVVDVCDSYDSAVASIHYYNEVVYNRACDWDIIKKVVHNKKFYTD